MPQPSIMALEKDAKFEGYLLVRTADQRTSSNGSKYLDMTLCDKTGDINSKMWDGTVPPPKSGGIVKIRGTVQEYNGRMQMRVEKLREASPQDDIDIAQLMPCAPESPKAMLAEIHQTIDAMQTPPLQGILRELLKLTGDVLSYFPAAQRLHHAERSGLLHHTTSMLRSAKALLPLYPFLDADLLLAGVIAHDLSKTTELVSDEAGNVSDYSTQGLLLGHLVTGVAQIQEAARRAEVMGEYVLLMQHMVISHHGEAEYGSPRPPMFPEAVMLHMLDDMDAKMNEMESVVRRTPIGAFSEKIWSLDRRVYHPRYEKEMNAAAEAASVDAEEEKVVVKVRSSADAQKAYEGLL